MKYFITFGQKYRRESHPSGHAVHPDCWYEIDAANEVEARELAFARFGRNWAFIYPENAFNKTYFPGGKLGEIMRRQTTVKDGG